jgi:hypothetical protein
MLTLPIGIDYYRLIQTEFDSSKEYSKLLGLSVEGIMVFMLFTNSLGNAQTLPIKVNIAHINSESLLLIYDIAGKLIVETPLKVSDTNGFSQEDLQLEEEIYFVKLETAFSSLTKKLIVKK